MKRLVLITGSLTLLLFVLVACKKWEDPPPTTDPRLTTPYCNDPAAVNYNWNFPGIPNDSVCYYPADLYKGASLFYDSIYLPNGVFSYVSGDGDTLHMFPLSKTQIGVIGFCSNGDTIRFNVDKTYQCTTDSTPNFVKGQMYCTMSDTVTGTIMPNIADSTNATLIVNLTVFSDTAVNVHKSTILKPKQ